MAYSSTLLSLALGSSVFVSSVSAKEPERVLFADRSLGNVTILNGDTFEQIGTVDLTLGAHELGVSPDGILAIGSAYGSGAQHKQPDNRLAIFNLDTRKVTSIIDLGEHARPNDIVFCADNQHALITTEAKQSLLQVDAQRGEVIKVIPLAFKAGHMLAGQVDCRRAYVSHVLDGKVSVVDMEKGEVVGTVDAAFGAEGIAIAPDNSSVWVANNRSNTITVFDPASLETLATLNCDGFPFRLRVSPDSTLVAVTCPMSDEVVVFDAAQRRELKRVNLARAGLGEEAGPQGIAFSADSKRLFVACPPARRVISLDVATGSIIHEFETGEGLDALTTAPATDS